MTFFGDGASNQGVFFESLNLAALWQLPVIFVCENNLYSEWTNYERLTAGSGIVERGRPFGIPSYEVDGNDVLAVARRHRRGRAPGPRPDAGRRSSRPGPTSTAVTWRARRSSAASTGPRRR